MRLIDFQQAHRPWRLRAWYTTAGSYRSPAISETGFAKPAVVSTNTYRDFTGLAVRDIESWTASRLAASRLASLRR